MGGAICLFATRYNSTNFRNPPESGPLPADGPIAAVMPRRYTEKHQVQTCTKQTASANTLNRGDSMQKPSRRALNAQIKHNLDIVLGCRAAQEDKVYSIQDAYVRVRSELTLRRVKRELARTRHCRPALVAIPPSNPYPRFARSSGRGVTYDGL
jgi:hypothetical protein